MRRGRGGRNQKHQRTPGKAWGGGLGPLVHVEEGTCSLPWKGPRAGAGFGPSLRHPAGCWGADLWVPGLALSCWRAAWGGERFFTPALGRGLLSAGPAPGPSGVTRTGPRAGGAKGAPKGGLISFPRAAEVSAKCLSHLFKFYGAWLVADGRRPGEEAGAGSGSLPRLRGSSRRQGADQTRDTRACDPPLVFPSLPARGLGCWGPEGGVCL